MTSAIFNIYTFVGNLYDRLDVVLLSRLAGNLATGIYSAAYRPLGTVQLLPYGILYSLLPALARGKCSTAERARFEKILGLLLCCGFLIVLTTIAFADAAVPFIYGRRFAESAAAVKIIIWAVILRYINYAFNTVLLAARRERIFVITSLVCLAVNLGGNLLFIPIYSWRAAAVITTVTEMALFGQNVFWLLKLFGAIPKPYAWIKSSVLFVVLAAVLNFVPGGHPSPWTGITCILMFLAYLLWSGILMEFRRAWQAQSAAI